MRGIAMDNTNGSTESALEPQRWGPPWEDPNAGNLFQRLLQTIIQGTTNPTELFDNMRTSGGLLQPLFFYALIVGPALLISTLLELPFQLMLGTSAAEHVIMLILLLVALPFLLPIGLFIAAGLTHLALMILGGATQPFEATFRVNAYAYGTIGWLSAVPFCGAIIGLVWGIVLEVIGIARVHEISTGKAAAAVLLPLAIIVILAMCVAIAFGIALAGALAGAS
jgi:hypothetical protein